MRRLDINELSERDGIGRNLGIEYVDLEPERVVLRMPVDERHHQPLGYLHGGVSVVLAESAATIGGWLNCPPGKAAFGSEINASHVRPKRSGTLTATATPVHRGRSSQVWEIHLRDEDDRAVCVSRCTLAIVDAGE